MCSCLCYNLERFIGSCRRTEIEVFTYKIRNHTLQKARGNVRNKEYLSLTSWSKVVINTWLTLTSHFLVGTLCIKAWKELKWKQQATKDSRIGDHRWEGSFWGVPDFGWFSLQECKVLPKERSERLQSINKVNNELNKNITFIAYFYKYKRPGGWFFCLFVSLNLEIIMAGKGSSMNGI